MHSNIKHMFVSNTIFQQKETEMSGEMADFGNKGERYKLSLEHLMVPESEQVLQNKIDCQRDTATYLKLPSGQS